MMLKWPKDDKFIFEFQLAFIVLKYYDFPQAIKQPIYTIEELDC